jgi:hypothetical protein
MSAVAETVATTITSTFMMTAWLLWIADLRGLSRPMPIRDLFHELRVFYLPAAAAAIAAQLADHTFGGWLDIFNAAAAIAYWWLLKDFDRDRDRRWARRRARLQSALGGVFSPAFER